MTKHLRILLLCSCLFALQSAIASSIFFPDLHPSIIKAEAPDWLKESVQNDGYLSITSQVITENSCTNISDHSFWGNEKTQLVVSATTSGFKSKLNKTEIPIATFDGRESGAECASLASTPVQILPLTLLGSGSGSSLNQENLSIVLNVKSSNDANHDFIGSAKLLLGAAAMVVSGGSASAIGGISATVGGSVASETQSRANNLLKGMVDAKVPLLMNWDEIRSRIKAVEVSVYRSEKGMGDEAEKKILQLQNNPKSEKVKLFTIRLTFNFTRTLFSSNDADIDHLYLREDLSSVHVLNYQMQGANQNFMQILNNTSPSLLQSISRAKAQNLTSACALGFEKLKNLDLNNLDMAIVMKSFIDEAKSDSSWYNDPASVRYCFEQVPNVFNYLTRIYGIPEPQFIIGDVQNGTGPKYEKWKNVTGPLLSEFRRALIAKGDRKAVIAQFNHNKDINLTFAPEIVPWTTQQEKSIPSQETTLSSPDKVITSPDENTAPKQQLLVSSTPGIDLLSSENFKTMGCYIYKDAENIEPSTYGAYFIMKNEINEYFVASSKFYTNAENGIKSINISELTPDWIQHFGSYSYPGGECKTILQSLQH